MILKKAWGDLRARKLRTALVVFSVGLAVFGVSAITLLGEQLARSATEKYLLSNPPDLVVNTAPLTDAQRAVLHVVPNVRTVETRSVGTVRWRPPGSEQTETLAVQSTPPAEETALDRVRVVQGRLPQGAEVLFEKSARQKYRLAIGQPVTLIGAEGERTYTIAGFGENPNVPPAAVVGFAAAWLPHDEAVALLKLRGDNRVLLALHDAGTAAVREDTEQRVREALEGAEVTVLASEVRDPASTPGQAILTALRTLLLVFGLAGAGVSGLLVVNTIGTLVLEQRPQIGVMKAIGGTTRHVLATYLTLAALYGALGTALGLVAGVVFATLMEGARAAALDEPAGALTVSGPALALVIGLGMGSCLVAALVPSWLGARLGVREALVSYGLGSAFGRRPWDRLALRLHTGRPVVLLAARNVFRQPVRALLTLLGLAGATAMLLATLAALNALARSLDAAEQALRAHLVFGFDALVEREAVDRTLAGAAGVAGHELWLTTTAKVGDRPVTVNGLPPDTAAFDTSTVRADGHWLEAGATDQAVVTQRLAQRHGLQVGSPLELANGTHPARRWTVVGIVPGAGADALAPEGAVYAPYEAVRALADFPPGRGNQLYVRLADGAPAQVDAQAAVLADTLAGAGLSAVPVKLYEQRANNRRVFIGFVLLFSAMIMIVALVGGLGLFGTLTMNVFERRQEIGVLRALGTPTGAVVATYVLEGVLLGALGWGLGVLLGAPGSHALVGFFSDTLVPLDYAFPARGVVVTALVVAAVALVASAGPALLAARLRIADVLRYA